MANEVELLANVLFSETKDPADARGIASVILNRMKRPERFGGSLEEVVLAPHQFSGVGTEEWNKAASRKFKNAKEESIYKQMIAVAGSALKGTLKDETGGADHYANLKLSKPSWAKVYKKTTEIGDHTYFSERQEKPKAVKKAVVVEPKKRATPVSFTDAFTAAKEKGLSEFRWRGNRYTTRSK